VALPAAQGHRSGEELEAIVADGVGRASAPVSAAEQRRDEARDPAAARRLREQRAPAAVVDRPRLSGSTRLKSQSSVPW
jgi:hypothetical protein